MMTAVDETPEQWKARMGIGQRSGIALGPNQTHTTMVPHEADGRPAGFQTEHRDGRMDATVLARPVNLSTRVQEPR